MAMTRERSGITFELRDMLLSILTGFRFVTDAVACAILKRTGFEPLSETTAQKIFKACDSIQLLSLLS